jgi:hypothetical protein
MPNAGRARFHGRGPFFEAPHVTLSGFILRRLYSLDSGFPDCGFQAL